MVGWRRSGERTLLCPFSLQTGNLTGNFWDIRDRPSERRLSSRSRRFKRKFPTQQTGNYVGLSREFRSTNREFTSSQRSNIGRGQKQPRRSLPEIISGKPL